MRTVLFILVLTGALTQLFFNVVSTDRVVVEIDATASLIRVIDGDTVEAVLLNVSSKFRGRVYVNQRVYIRLADINAPELYVEGVRNEAGWRSREALINLLKGANILYLDIDDAEVYDWYDRLIAVIYINYNSTHLLNVNKWLVDNGYARIWDFRNATDPGSWLLYVDKKVVINGNHIGNEEGGRSLYNNKVYLEIAVVYATIAVAATAAFIYVWRTTGVKK